MMQTMKDKWVKLFLVVIDEDIVNMKLKNMNEVQAIKWISVATYLHESLNFGLSNVTGQNNKHVQYQTFLVKGFAFEICQWIFKLSTGPLHGGIKLTDPQ